MVRRVDIVSDTHGRLSRELMAAIDGCDLLIHAGDITSERDWAELEASVSQVRAVLGNNDWYYDYGPAVQRVLEFDYEGLHFAVAHYQEDVMGLDADVAVCGHTHRPVIERAHGRLLVNPGSASLPRGCHEASIARLMIEAGTILSAEIVGLR